jgi:hypothetical protein
MNSFSTPLGLRPACARARPWLRSENLVLSSKLLPTAALSNGLDQPAQSVVDKTVTDIQSIHGLGGEGVSAGKKQHGLIWRQRKATTPQMWS